jgi:molecular chaperone DnaK (HSP70)
MKQVFGIDLGTTYSAIARLNENGMPEIIENFTDSVPLLASAVYFPEGGDPVVGKEAKNQAEVDPSRVVQFIKREIGKPDACVRNFDGVDYDPVTISALILKRMKEYAEEQGYEVKDVVITCPAYFKVEERTATRQAGEIAGFTVLNIVNEPTAAALNYCSREFQENRKILVYDLGGGTFDVTIVDFSATEGGQPVVKVLATEGDDRLGGIDWDARLYDYICEQYQDETGVSQDEMDAELIQKIKSQVEDVKRSLSNMPSRSFTINYAGDSTHITVTREKFEEITSDLVEKTTTFIHALLEKAELTVEDIDTVLLVGGSTRMPMVKDAVEAIFTGNKVRREDPDQAVAKGACLAAAIEWNVIVDKIINPTPVPAPVGPTTGEGEPVQQNPVVQEIKDRYPGLTSDDLVDVGSMGSGGITYQDILSCSFGPAVFSNGVYVIDNILFKGDDSPSEATKCYQTMVDNQAGVEIPIYENVAIDKENTQVTPCFDENDNEQWTDPALAVKRIGSVEFQLPPGTPKGSPIEVTFKFSTSGLLVTAGNLSTGESFPVQILSPNTKSDAEVAQDTKRIGAMTTSGQI